MSKRPLLVAPMIRGERRSRWAEAERAWLVGDMATVDRIEDELRAADAQAFEAEVALWLAGTDAAGAA